MSIFYLDRYNIRRIRPEYKWGFWCALAGFVGGWMSCVALT